MVHILVEMTKADNGGRFVKKVINGKTYTQLMALLDTRASSSLIRKEAAEVLELPATARSTL